MRISARGVVRVAAIVAIVFAQTAAAPPHKPPPYKVNWYLHPQTLGRHRRSQAEHLLPVK